MKLLKLTNLTLLALGLALTQPAFAADDDKKGGNDKVTAHDKAWAQMAAISDLTELTLAKAAQEKAQSEQVKQHAAKMIEDHTKTTAELKAWAKENDVDLEAKLPEHKQAMVKEITSKSGPEFDKAYLEHEIMGHRHAVTHFRNGSEFNKNPELKQFAAKTLPVIEGHLAMVDKGGDHSRHTTGAQPASGGSVNPAGQAGAGQGSPTQKGASGSQQQGQVRAE
jgi:putative membrane protein